MILMRYPFHPQKLIYREIKFEYDIESIQNFLYRIGDSSNSFLLYGELLYPVDIDLMDRVTTHTCRWFIFVNGDLVLTEHDHRVEQGNQVNWPILEAYLLGSLEELPPQSFDCILT